MCRRAFPSPGIDASRPITISAASATHAGHCPLTMTPSRPVPMHQQSCVPLGFAALVAHSRPHHPGSFANRSQCQPRALDRHRRVELSRATSRAPCSQQRVSEEPYRTTYPPATMTLIHTRHPNSQRSEPVIPAGTQDIRADRCPRPRTFLIGQFA